MFAVGYGLSLFWDTNGRCFVYGVLTIITYVKDVYNLQVSDLNVM